MYLDGIIHINFTDPIFDEKVSIYNLVKFIYLV